MIILRCNFEGRPQSQTLSMLSMLCGLFLLIGLGRGNGFAHDESRAGLFGQLTSLLGSAH
jgi:hypothetical protein